MGLFAHSQLQPRLLCMDPAILNSATTMKIGLGFQRGTIFKSSLASTWLSENGNFQTNEGQICKRISQQLLTAELA